MKCSRTTRESSALHRGCVGVVCEREQTSGVGLVCEREQTSGARACTFPERVDRWAGVHAAYIYIYIIIIIKRRSGINPIPPTVIIIIIIEGLSLLHPRS